MSSENRYLGAPILSLQVMLRVLAQAEGEISGVIPDGIYGPETTRSVAAFQQKHGIEASGQADHATWNQIVDAFTRRSPLVLPAAPLSIVWQPMQTIAHGEENLQLHLIQGMLSAIRCVFPQMDHAGHTAQDHLCLIRLAHKIRCSVLQCLKLIIFPFALRRDDHRNSR